MTPTAPDSASAGVAERSGWRVGSASGGKRWRRLGGGSAEGQTGDEGDDQDDRDEEAGGGEKAAARSHRLPRGSDR